MSHNDVAVVGVWSKQRFTEVLRLMSVKVKVTVRCTVLAGVDVDELTRLEWAVCS